MNQRTLKKGRQTSYIRFAPKKLFISCSMGLMFFSLTFMFTFRSPLCGSGIYHAFKMNKTIFKTISPERELQNTSKTNEQSLQYPKRINIIIISSPRSGSSFLGEIFNQHSDVFYLFEPLHTVQKSVTQHSGLEFKFSSSSYQKKAFQLFDDMMNCNFGSGIFIRYLVPGDRERSLVLNSPPFCSKNEKSTVCYKLTSQQLETVCKNNYGVFAAKILTHRLPISNDEWNKKFLQSCSSNGASECKIIHLVRDPRAVVESLRNLNFFRQFNEPEREFSWYVEKICHQIEVDVKIGKFLSTVLPDGYKLIRFEDLALTPLLVVSELYHFTGIEMLDSIKKWLRKATTTQNAGPYSTSRVSKQVVSKWKTNMSPEKVQIVESLCGRLMKKLNYTLTGT